MPSKRIVNIVFDRYGHCKLWLRFSFALTLVFVEPRFFSSSFLLEMISLLIIEAQTLKVKTKFGLCLVYVFDRDELFSFSTLKWCNTSTVVNVDQAKYFCYWYNIYGYPQVIFSCFCFAFSPISLFRYSF